MDVAALLLAVALIVIAYLLGAIPWGVVIARVIGGPDPRSVGSGRTGGANVARTLGLRWAVLAGCLDIAKGLVAAGLPILLHAGDATVILAALAAVIGHSRSPFIRFAGGRGVSPGIGGLLAIAWPAALVGVPVFVVVFAVTHISSIASLTASLVAGVGMVVMTSCGSSRRSTWPTRWPARRSSGTSTPTTSGASWRVRNDASGEAGADEPADGRGITGTVAALDWSGGRSRMPEAQPRRP